MGGESKELVLPLLRERGTEIVSRWAKGTKASSRRYSEVPLEEIRENLTELFDAMLLKLEKGDGTELDRVIREVSCRRAVAGFSLADTLSVIEVGLETVIDVMRREFSSTRVDDCCDEFIRVVRLFNSISVSHATVFEDVRRSDFVAKTLSGLTEASEELEEHTVARKAVASIHGTTGLDVALLILGEDGEFVEHMAEGDACVDGIDELCREVVRKGETAVQETAVGVPVTARGGTIGSLAAVRGRGNAVSEHEIRLLKAVADQIGLVCDNARVYKGIMGRLEELQAGHSVLFSILSGLEAAVYVADMETYEMLAVNSMMERMFGSDLVGKKCYEVIQRGQQGPCPFCTNDRIVEDGRPTEPFVWKFQNTATGRWFKCIDRAIEWPDGRLVRLEAAFDITDMERATEEAEGASRTLKLYNDILVHDLGNYASTIRGFLDMLLEEPGLDKRHRALVDRAYAQAGKCLLMLDNISAFNKLTTVEDDARSRQDLNDILDEAIRDVSVISHEPPPRIVKGYGEEAHEVVAGAFAKEIFLNLLTNAVKYGEGGEVILDMEGGELNGRPAWCVSVSDHGHGIPPDRRDALFGRYSRLEGGKRVEGKGLGLHIAHTLAERYGGTLEVGDRVPGDHTQGARFTATLPRA